MGWGVLLWGGEGREGGYLYRSGPVLQRCFERVVMLEFACKIQKPEFPWRGVPPVIPFGLFKIGDLSQGEKGTLKKGTHTHTDTYQFMVAFPFLERLDKRTLKVGGRCHKGIGWAKAGQAAQRPTTQQQLTTTQQPNKPAAQQPNKPTTQEPKNPGTQPNAARCLESRPGAIPLFLGLRRTRSTASIDL